MLSLREKMPFIATSWLAGCVNIPFIYLNLQKQSYIFMGISIVVFLFCVGVGIRILLD